MTTNQAFLIVGRKTCGERLSVAIYSPSKDEAERQYEFRYRGLGYLLPKDFTITPGGDSIPMIKFRSRNKHELHQSHTEEDTTRSHAATGLLERSLDYLQGDAKQDDQNVVYLG